MTDSYFTDSDEVYW